ncbi:MULTISPECIES: Rv3235 family protein [unclassified Brevibacterium]|jgi:hypothetical protein|uniref:Rv3235 family protein n=1 Tax=unclassified Brevibacterium TaxID=2614124 RepID=UPI001BADC793|nr:MULTISPECIES: Rv3235 family protein [unclassified Brevibacterium]QUL80900.1 energy transducer TonB [Brevibacterium sp. SMBL_HHYL_HB1]
MNAPLTLSRPQAATSSTRREHPRLRGAHGHDRGPDREVGDESERIAATATSLAVACLEILSGVRRSETIARWVDPQLLERIDHRAQLRAEVAPTHPPAELGSPRVVQPGTAHVCQVTPTVAEVTVIVATPNRFRAVAVRLELLTTRWTLTALQTM